jgi:hypothetical protein
MVKEAVRDFCVVDSVSVPHMADPHVGRVIAPPRAIWRLLGRVSTRDPNAVFPKWIVKQQPIARGAYKVSGCGHGDVAIWYFGYDASPSRLAAFVDAGRTATIDLTGRWQIH